MEDTHYQHRHNDLTKLDRIDGQWYCLECEEFVDPEAERRDRVKQIYADSRYRECNAQRKIWH